MKTSRQEEILQIIESHEIETQEELANQLRTRGYKVTQATVSRDIKELRLIKIAGQRSARASKGFPFFRIQRRNR